MSGYADTTWIGEAPKVHALSGVATGKNAKRQAGGALIAFLTLVVLASASIGLAKLNNDARMDLDEQIRTLEALSEAKAALLAYAVTYPDNYANTDPAAGPGYLPCPDTDNDGYPDQPCGPNAIGRLPNKLMVDVDGDANDEDILGLEHVRDGAGERLWYAVSNDFLNDPLSIGLNSETFGQLILDSASADEDRVVALIIAPGSPFLSQIGRSTAPNDITNYLEDDNSSTGDGSFVSVSSGQFNDQVVAITRGQLMALVEKRVMGEVSQAIELYNTNYGNAVPNTFVAPRLSPFGDPRTDVLVGSAANGSGTTTLVANDVNFVELGVRVGDVANNVSDNSLGMIDSVSPTSVTVTRLLGGSGNNFSPGDSYRIGRFNAVVGATEGLVPFHDVDEPFQTDFVADWNLQDGNGINVSVSGGIPAYGQALEDFVESTTWSGSVPVSRDNGVCLWTDDGVSDVKCVGFFTMTFFVGLTTKTHVSELEDSTLHFDEWGVVAGTIVENLDDVGVGGDAAWGIVDNVSDDTLQLQTGLTDGVKNRFDIGDRYRVRMPSRSTSSSPYLDASSSSLGSTLYDIGVDYQAEGIEVGDSIFNVDDNEWGVITGFHASLSHVLFAAGMSFDPGDRYVIRYDFVEDREYELVFDYTGPATEYGLIGTKRRNVCSNDGAIEVGGADCRLSGGATSASGLTLTDLLVDFGVAGVNVGDMIFNLTDGSRGIIAAIVGNQLTVSSLNGGVSNNFTTGDLYRISLTENLNNEPGLDVTNDDLVNITIRDREDDGSIAGFATAKVPDTGSASGSVDVQAILVDLEIQKDIADTDYDLPLWFVANNWHRLTYVATASQLLPGQSGFCNVGTDCLTVSGVTPGDDVGVLVLAAGAALATQDRAAGTACGAVEPTFLCDYFEGENADFDFDEAGPPPPTFEHTRIVDVINDQVRLLTP